MRPDRIVRIKDSLDVTIPYRYPTPPVVEVYDENGQLVLLGLNVIFDPVNKTIYIDFGYLFTGTLSINPV